MAYTPIEKAHVVLAGDRLFACVAEHGSFAHAYYSDPVLLAGPHSTRNLADAVHFLCNIHGRYPGITDLASTHSTNPLERKWLAQAIENFSVERAFLANLAVKAGPIPSTLGARNAETALLTQRHTLDMLARSERPGCAIGTAMALVIDWCQIRVILNVAGNRFGVEPPKFGLANISEIRSLADMLATSPSIERAILFGAQQIMLQHYGLWDLLESRQLARMVTLA